MDYVWEMLTNWSLGSTGLWLTKDDKRVAGPFADREAAMEWFNVNHVEPFKNGHPRHARVFKWYTVEEILHRWGYEIKS